MHATLDDLEQVFRYAEGLEKRLAVLENRPQPSTAKTGDLDQVEREVTFLRAQINDVRANLPTSGFTAPEFGVRFLTFGGYALLWSGLWSLLGLVLLPFIAPLMSWLYNGWPAILGVAIIGVMGVMIGKAVSPSDGPRTGIEWRNFRD